jgi:DNA-nicking Smr family endonuclease
MAKKTLKSLDELASLRLADKGPKPGTTTGSPPVVRRAGKPAVESGPPPSAEEEQDQFLAAVQGASPMPKAAHGRQIAQRPVAPAGPRPETPGGARRLALGRALAGGIEFELEYSEEYMQGFVRDIDPRLFSGLKAGRFSVEAHLDLHGLNSGQALDHLLFFVRESFLLGRRCLLLVTGRGRNSPGGYSVLKQEIQGWLTRDPLRRLVLAFCTAQPRDGGGGALYVLLRRRKKGAGKVRFDTLAQWEDA